MNFPIINTDIFKSIDPRKLTRNIFRFLLVGLIVSSCVTSVAWFGEMTNSPYDAKRYRPQYQSYPNYNHDFYDSRENTRPPVDDEYEEENEPRISHPNGEYYY
jgi:hypothetical protein